MKKLTKAQIKERDELIAALEQAAANINTFKETIRDEQGAYFETKSDKWAESERGEAYSEWMDCWDGYECDVTDLVTELQELAEEPG